MPFPFFPNKYQEKSLITAEQCLEYYKKVGRLPAISPPEGLILCYDPKIMRYVIENEKVKKIPGLYGSFYLLEDTKGKIGICGNFGIGGPVISIVIEEYSMFGIKNFISIGIAGSLQKNLRLGSIIICNRALRDEGTSHHYFPDEKFAYPSQYLTTQIEVAVKKLDFNYILGPSWTTDAPYRETLVEVNKYREEGICTVDMEAATLFCVAQYRNVNAGAIFTISDILGETNWDPQFHLTENHLQRLFAIAKLTLQTI